ncbi:GDSL esterase/lipase At4g16230-like [Papaver somniferum]|uniref:GDSL esterase/lipase At4g16230-like n=1 Tax=Papaver somniferum TaxID=3469 RepID=UPI000E704ED2|nr:GDSL esterase/lipase At4g16230-like [Papaver somniferum]
MIIITSSYSNSLHAAHLLLMVLAVFTMSCSSSNSVLRPLENNHIDQPPAIFVFGVSLVDPGNNNYISGTIAKNNFYPFGIDFPSGKAYTGRFTDGRTGYIPPYMDPTTVGDVVLRGVNYASGGAGILNDSGAIFGNRFNMDAQLDNFANTRNYIISNISGGGSKKLLENALFIIVMGSNDFLHNYFTPIISIPKQKLESPGMFVDSMISKFRLQLIRLYEMDAKKNFVPNLGPLGCIPEERALNYSLQIMMATTWYLIFSVIINPMVRFEDYKTACWKLLPDPPRGFYSHAPLVCKDRSKYVFWDFAHPSDAANVILAKMMLEDPDSGYTYPMNVRQLYYS